MSALAPTIPMTAPNAPALSWRVPAIDGLRALAILMVFAFHAWEFSGKPGLVIGAFGRSFNIADAVSKFPAGVDLFMVLSGFCLFLPLCKENGLQKWRLGSYFARRVRRIAPPYYAAILYAILLPQILVLVFRAAGMEAKWQPLPSAWQVVSHLTFIHTLFVETWSGINGSFWSLGLEAQFYLAFPVAVWGFARFGPRFLLAIIAISLLYRFGVTRYLIGSGQPTGDDKAFVLSIFFLGRWMQFAAGMAAAWLVAAQWKAGRELTAQQGTALLLGSLLLYTFAVSSPITGIISFPLRDLLLGVVFAGAIVALCASPTRGRALFENRFATSLGFISYSLFLIHQPTLWYLSELLRKKAHLDGLILMVSLCTLGLALIVAIAYVFFLLVERPFLNTTSAKKSAQTIDETAGPDETARNLPVQGIIPAPQNVPIVEDQSVP